MSKYLSFFILLFFSFWNNTFAQFGLSHEVGIVTGPITLQSDFTGSDRVTSAMSNSGFGFGVVGYLGFTSLIDYRKASSYFYSHFKIRGEFSYYKINSEFTGKWTEGNSESAKQLKAMKGSSSLINLGLQLEYYPLDLNDFESNDGGLAPFISIGTQYTLSSSSHYSELGPGLGNLATVTPQKYLGAFREELGKAFSIVSSMGVRYKINTSSDIMLDLRGQLFFSDWVDGLNPNKLLYKENKSNDSAIILNLGYIYYLD